MYAIVLWDEHTQFSPIRAAVIRNTIHNTTVVRDERTRFSPIRSAGIRNTIRNSGWGVRHSEGTQPTVHWSITVLGHTDEGPTRDKCTLLNPKDCWDRDGTQPTTQWFAV